MPSSIQRQQLLFLVSARNKTRAPWCCGFAREGGWRGMDMDVRVRVHHNCTAVEIVHRALFSLLFNEEQCGVSARRLAESPYPTGNRAIPKAIYSSVDRPRPPSRGTRRLSRPLGRSALKERPTSAARRAGGRARLGSRRVHEVHGRQPGGPAGMEGIWELAGQAGGRAKEGRKQVKAGTRLRSEPTD